MSSKRTNLESHIISVAKQLFIEKGYVATSMGDIAQQAGVTRPSLHYYFSTKESMFQAVFGSIVGSLLPRSEEILSRPIPIMERLELIVGEYLELFKSNPSLPQFLCGEIRRNADHLVEEAKLCRLDEFGEIIRLYLGQEMAAGNIRTVPIHIVFMSIYSSLTFPFLARELLVHLFLEGNQARFEPFLQEWKLYIMDSLRALLCKDAPGAAAC
ncbi:MAG: TetR/AcrR family transcriptional regulator [Akkermansiaceae bacterium]|nr:TetR/AcrR family transcriptional regulator [Akkermansiaceae bacterium]